MIKFEFVKKAGEDVDNIDKILNSVKNRVKYLVSGKYLLVVKKKTTQRNIQQNNLYHLWLNIISQETGNSVSALHEFFKNKFLTHETKEVLGTAITIPPTTKTLNTKEFSVFLDMISGFSSQELGIILPSPEDVPLLEILKTELE